MIERYIYEGHNGITALFTVHKEGLFNFLAPTRPVRLTEEKCLAAFKAAVANSDNKVDGPSYQSRFALWKGFMELDKAAKKAAWDKKMQGSSGVAPLTPDLF